jgi:hypothetical protein
MNGPYVLVYCKRLRPAELTPLLGSLKLYLEHVPKVAYSLYGDPARAAQLYGAAPQVGAVPPEGAAPPPAAGPILPPPPAGGTFQP